MAFVARLLDSPDCWEAPMFDREARSQRPRPRLGAERSAWLAGIGALVLIASGCPGPPEPVRVEPVVTAGYQHTCVLTSSGGVKCWGLNSTGQLGTQYYDSSQRPVDVVGLTSGTKQVDAGHQFTCAVTVGGGAKCWGLNASGQLGRVGNFGTDAAPGDVTGLSSGVRSISAGGGHACAVTIGGGVKCWGYNFHGELGDGTTSNVAPYARAEALDVVGLPTNVVAVAAGSQHTCALTAGGGVKCWGDNTNGQLGDGTSESSALPVDVVGLGSGVASVAAADVGHTCAVTNGGAVLCWGMNNAGQLGNGSAGPGANSLVAVPVVGLGSGVRAIALGLMHTCASTAAGMECWGSGFYGGLGNGSMGSGATSATPVNVVDLGAVTSLAAGDLHTCAVTTAGGVRCWGQNNAGQLGDASTTDRAVPVDVLTSLSVN